MRKIRIVFLSLAAFGLIAMISSFVIRSNNALCDERSVACEVKESQLVNVFVTHGHCSTPFSGVVDDLIINPPVRNDLGNPLENMEMSFSINPHSFNACRGEELTERIKTPGLFIGNNDEQIKFKSTSVYTMGIDWYQINGKLSIKGVEREVKFFASGIRAPEQSITDMLVLEGQVNLLDWGIDYDLIVNGQSSDVPTKWMHLNMKVKLKKGC